MNPRDFLSVAEDLLEATREADWRTAVSRAYYSAFLVAVELFREVGFDPPPDKDRHSYVYVRLNNCGRAEVVRAAGCSISADHGTRPTTTCEVNST